MRIYGVDFGNVLNSSGARGFCKEGYWFHGFVPGLNYGGATFVAKTTTLHAREGNMPLKGSMAPVQKFPRCVVVKPRKGVVLNSVGLSGPGMEALTDRWLEDRSLFGTPWMISLMSVAGTPAERRDEVREMALVLRRKGIWSLAGLQLNLSCPNVGLDPVSLSQEGLAQLDELEYLGMPTLVKVSVLFPVKAALRLLDHPACHGIVCSNTVPWGKLPDRIDWRGLFGSDESPLAHLGGGGLSGKPLLPLVAEWIRELRFQGATKPVVGGGGILMPGDADVLLDAGADAVELGSVSILRPWRIRSIIRHVNRRCNMRG